jgi:hypothetical protein
MPFQDPVLVQVEPVVGALGRESDAGLGRSCVLSKANRDLADVFGVDNMRNCVGHVCALGSRLRADAHFLPEVENVEAWPQRRTFEGERPIFIVEVGWFRTHREVECVISHIPAAARWWLLNPC